MEDARRDAARAPKISGIGKEEEKEEDDEQSMKAEADRSLIEDDRRVPTRAPNLAGIGKEEEEEEDEESMKAEADCFELSASSVLNLHKGDITLWSVDGSTDAIVNAADELMLGGGGVDGAIHRAAGPELLEACRKVPEVRPGVRCPTGEARITPAFRLPVAHVIHTVGPIYYRTDQPVVALANACRNSLRLAKESGIQYVAFPAISCGVDGYPYNEASRIAISTVEEFSDGIKEVHFVLFSHETHPVWLEGARELFMDR